MSVCAMPGETDRERDREREREEREPLLLPVPVEPGILIQTHTHTLSLSLSHTHTHAHSHAQKHKHTHSLTHTLGSQSTRGRYEPIGILGPPALFRPQSGGLGGRGGGEREMRKLRLRGGEGGFES
jgi:hypothetical protein